MVGSGPGPGRVSVVGGSDWPGWVGGGRVGGGFCGPGWVGWGTVVGGAVVVEFSTTPPRSAGGTNGALGRSRVARSM